MPPGGPDTLLHVSFLIGDARVMLSDGVPRKAGGFRGFGLFDRLSMVTDRFGVQWMVTVDKSPWMQERMSRRIDHKRVFRASEERTDRAFLPRRSPDGTHLTVPPS